MQLSVTKGVGNGRDKFPLHYFFVNFRADERFNLLFHIPIGSWSGVLHSRIHEIPIGIY